MPVAPYDLVQDVLNTARVRLNDAIQSIGGDILTDLAPFTQTAVNAAWRRLQELLVNLGFARLKVETIFTLVSAVGSADVGSQVWIGWTGYFNGLALSGTPALPQDLIAPLDLWERQSGSGASYAPMDQLLNGLPTVPKQSLNRIWEWRQEAIYMPGALSPTDIRLRYAAFLPDFVDVGLVFWYQQPVPIMRSLNSLAWFICSEIAKARGDLDAGGFDQQAVAAAQLIWNRDPMQGKSITKRSEYGKMPDRYTPAMGPAGPRGQQGE